MVFLPFPLPCRCDYLIFTFKSVFKSAFVIFCVLITGIPGKSKLFFSITTFVQAVKSIAMMSVLAFQRISINNFIPCKHKPVCTSCRNHRLVRHFKSIVDDTDIAMHHFTWQQFMIFRSNIELHRSGIIATFFK